MAQTIKNMNDLAKALDKYISFAVDKTADKIKQKIDEFIRYYYHEYTPDQYQRVWNFLNSVTRTDVEKNGNTWSVKVYIDTSIKYDNGWTMEGTAVQANAGMHGWYHAVKVGDMHFWDDAMEEIMSPEFINKFADFLRRGGLKATII